MTTGPSLLRSQNSGTITPANPSIVSQRLQRSYKTNRDFLALFKMQVCAWGDLKYIERHNAALRKYREVSVLDNDSIILVCGFKSQVLFAWKLILDSG
jgi:hypothetical protein